ncbi:hypothetical protein [Epilithonimonas hungarica]|uniref:Uncharacterized protein n=1 Tax=Epilithonimonas hungarica TaxID=454006 RepID=A0A1G7F9D2_9FLAO|nr:hypothetical protein [Epilithonimonas hungarica]SDE72507.1 hypothetical protein SAMN05421825_0023 [Epilithonimonas hungarica]
MTNSTAANTMSSLLDFLKYLIPVLSAFLASFLTYRFSKKDKIRDHLFTYKVKAYLSLAEDVSKIQKDIIKLKNNIHFSRREIGELSPFTITDDLKESINRQSLFLSDKIKKDSKNLETAVYSLATIEEYVGKINTNPKKETLDKYQRAYIECGILIEKLQSDLGMHQIGTGNKK